MLLATLFLIFLAKPSYESEGLMDNIGGFPFKIGSGVTLENDDTDTPSEEVLAVARNSANLTRQAKQCDHAIYENFQNNTDDKNSQPSVPTIVDVKLIVLSLNGISDANGVVSLSAELALRWYDPRLAIDNSTDCQWEKLQVPTTDLWFPYFLVQNGADNIFYPDAFQNFPTLLHASGLLEWRVAFTFTLSCETDVSLFPFDTQHCPFMLESPHYDKEELIFQTWNKSRAIVLLNGHAHHPLWMISGQAATEVVEVPGLTLWIEYKRKYLYYMYTIVIPMLAVFLQTAATFVLPADNGEKLSTGTSGLLSYFFLFLLITDSVPQTSTNVPALLIFFAVQIVITIGVVVVCSIMGRLVCIEQAEEEKADLKSSPEGVRPCSGRSVLSTASDRTKRARNIKPASSSQQRIAEEAINGVAKELKKRRITSKTFNNICFITYVALVLGSILILVIYIAVGASKKSSARSHIATTPVEEYQIGE